MCKCHKENKTKCVMRYNLAVIYLLFQSTWYKIFFDQHYFNADIADRKKKLYWKILTSIPNAFN